MINCLKHFMIRMYFAELFVTLVTPYSAESILKNIEKLHLFITVARLLYLRELTDRVQLDSALSHTTNSFGNIVPLQKFAKPFLSSSVFINLIPCCLLIQS